MPASSLNGNRFMKSSLEIILFLLHEFAICTLFTGWIASQNPHFVSEFNTNCTYLNYRLNLAECYTNKMGFAQIYICLSANNEHFQSLNVDLSDDARGEWNHVFLISIYYLV